MSKSKVTITLQDGFGNCCQVQLTPENAQRCETDLEFAQKVMNDALGIDSSVQPGPSSSSTNNVSDDASSSWSQQQNDDVATIFKWPYEAILLLVESYRSHESDLTSGKISQKKVWEKISTLMAEKGHVASGPQCMSKFNGMKRTFKAISDHNSKSGNNPRSWPYFELIQSLLGERPFMEPLALSSSTSGPMTGSESSSDRSTDSPRPSCSGNRSRKRQASEDLKSVADAILESRRIAEENKNKRHEEKSELKTAILAKLDALLEKI